LRRIPALNPSANESKPGIFVRPAGERVLKLLRHFRIEDLSCFLRRFHLVDEILLRRLAKPLLGASKRGGRSQSLADQPVVNEP
jgi:hypothetical protein